MCIRDRYEGLDNNKMDRMITEFVDQSFPSIDEIAKLGEGDRAKVFLQNVPKIQQRMIEILRAGFVAKFVDIYYYNKSDELVFHRLATVALSSIGEHINKFRVELKQEIKEHFDEIHKEFIRAEDSLFQTEFVEIKNLLSLLLNSVFVVKNRLESLMVNAEMNKGVELSRLEDKITFAMSLFSQTCVSANQVSSYSGIKRRILKDRKSVV